VSPFILILNAEAEADDIGVWQERQRRPEKQRRERSSPRRSIATTNDTRGGNTDSEMTEAGH
jgi:hypothetical protein